MRAVLIRSHGGYDVLNIEEIPAPVAGPGELLVRVHACGLNYLDIFVRRGMPGVRIDLPHVSGGDVAGVVEAVGPETSGWVVGQRVLVDPIIRMPGRSRGRGVLGEHAWGGLREYLAMPAENALQLPDGMDFEVAAALPIAYGTAHHMMIAQAKVAAGETVVILGASGGVGVASVQLAHQRGARVIAISSSGQKLARLRSLGADAGVDTVRVPDWGSEVWRLTGKRGADLVVNFTGGETWVPSLRCLRRGGRLVTCGATAGFDPQTDLRFIWTRELHIFGSNGWQRADLLAVIENVRRGLLQAVIDRVLPLEQIAEGERLIEERAVVGKIVMRL